MLNLRKNGVYKTYFFDFALFFILFLLTAGTSLAATAADLKEPVNIQVEVSALNFRTGPATSHRLLQPLPLGTPLQALFCEKDNWLLVRLADGRTGWVDGQYTSFSPDLVDKLPPAQKGKARINVNLLNVRLGPGLNYQKIEQLELNTAITVYFCEGGWLLARLADGSCGWIAAEYTTPLTPASNSDEPANESTDSIINNPLAGSAIADPPASASQSLPLQTVDQESGENREVTGGPYLVRINEDSLRLRAEPCLEGTPLATLPRDTILTAHQRTEDDWLQVTTADELQGWVAGWCTQQYAGQAGGVTTENYFRLATINADVLRVRQGPGLQYDQIGRISSGSHVLALKEQNGWHYVRLPDGSYGWICGDYATVKNIASRGETGNSSSLTQAITVVLDPGHGGKDSGATGHSGLKEKDVNLSVALHLANLLRAQGFNVILTRRDDQYIALAERVAIAEKAGADLFMSIHANASLNNKSASGTETYYYPNKESSPQSFFLASLAQQEVSAALNLPSIGVKKGSLHVLRETRMPAALVELAFLSNAVDETILRSEECLQLAAGALYRSILRYYNLL
jgi:N-acetylmuramoyl-L-alanine amidase